jgi:hypothetical protein
MFSVVARFCAPLSIVCCFALSSEASATTVTSISGKVSINRGNGFSRISTDTSAKGGDRVMAGPSGSAEIVYDDGCRVKVEPGAVVTIAATSSCKAEFVPHDMILGAAVVAGGVAGAIILSTNDNKPASP